MALIRRTWTPKEADEWTKEDTITVIISPIIYVLITLGTALSMLLIPVGFLLLAIGIILTLVMVYIINPKLAATSREYEKKQEQYLEALEKKIKWEEEE
jgi:ABC-type transport system involved in cytochrome bd biosynthesis fused ATPase/permease subunit